MALPSRPPPSSGSSLPFSLHLTLLSHALASYYTSTSPSLFGNQPYPSFPRAREDDSDDEGGEMDEAAVEGGRSLRDRPRQLQEFARWWLDVKQARSMDIMQRRVCAMVDSFTSHGLILLLHSLSPYQLPLLLPTLLLPLPLAFIPYNRSSLPLQPKTHPQPLIRRRTLLLQLLFQLPPLLFLSLFLFLSEIQRTTVLYILQLLRSRSSSFNRRSSSLPRLLLKGTPLPLPPPRDASSSVCAICVSPSGGELELFCPSGGHAYHRRCISRWLKVYTRGRREGDGTPEEGRVALVRGVDDDGEEVQEEEERALLSSLLRRDLGLRVTPLTSSQQQHQQHQHHFHPHLFPPPPVPLLSPNSQPTLLLASPSPLIPLTTSTSPTFLGTLTTTHPPCPTCRSPLVFQLHLSASPPPTSKSTPLATWQEFVSGETMLKERGGMQVGALVVVMVMGWLRREGGV